MATQASELINQLIIFLSSNNIAWLLSFFKELVELIFLAIDNIILGLCGKIIFPVNFLERRKSQEVLAEFIISLLFLMIIV